MRMTSLVGTKPLKLLSFTAIYILNIYSDAVASFTDALCYFHSRRPQILAGAIQESEFMNSEAKLNTKNV